ncbi:MAG: aldo/keto reductase [Cytophagales bacterium]|nr:MAG: aldo/keto reductase [Cytophagales bacterium]
MQYQLFGNTGLRVSELCLGTMTFGEEWGNGANKEISKEIFEAFVEVGGNFIDTANRYTEGSSERFLGDFIQYNRDYFVLATKYSLFDDRNDPNASGNHRKNLKRSVETSLKRLNTDYIDILWLHAWDFNTPVEEVMSGLNDLIRAGKVHYIGISDTPAWVVAKANTLAKERGWVGFEGLQIEYSLVQRTVERELVPMAQDFGMTVTPWSPLGGGVLSGKYNEGLIAGGRLNEKSTKYNPQNIAIAQKLTEIAQSLQQPTAAVAIQWLRQQPYANIIPVLGARNPQQLKEQLQCLHFQIPEEALQTLNAMSQVPLGFPHDFLKLDSVKGVLFGNNYAKIRHR